MSENRKNSTVAETIEKIKEADKCVIFTHTCTDGDALGAALALQRQMRALGKDAEVAVDSKVPDSFMYLDDMHGILHDIPRDSYDTFIAVDCASADVLGKFRDAFMGFKGVTVNIDHHSYNTRFAQFNRIGVCCSCCELLTDMFRKAGWETDAATASLLMLGLMTDSGRLTHMDVTAKSCMTAGYLCSCGADPYSIYENVYGKKSDEIVILHNAVMRSMKRFCTGKVAVITVHNSDFEKDGLDRSVTEGFEYYPLAWKRVQVSVLLKEQEGGSCFKAFLRSKAADLRPVAKKFGGSGRELACSCLLTGTEEECLNAVVDALAAVLDI
ncbi:MAG: DHH family phosphoesterase [Clostridia bacterium]|nr:DHH family phosphoesterase [Clostridia bacterium]